MTIASKIHNDDLRAFAKQTESEPSEFINTLSEASGQAVWFLTPDLEVAWKNSYTDKLIGAGFYKGSGYCNVLPNLRNKLEEMKAAHSTCSCVYKSGGKEYEVVCYPVIKEEEVKGFIVTLSEGIRARLFTLMEKQKKREEVLCSLQLKPL